MPVPATVLLYSIIFLLYGIVIGNFLNVRIPWILREPDPCEGEHDNELALYELRMPAALV